MLHIPCDERDNCNVERLYGRASADDVVQSVRRLRAERDQLRLKDRDHSRHMHQVSPVIISIMVKSVKSECRIW